MQRSLVDLLADCFRGRELTTKFHLSQIVQVGEGTKFTLEIEKALPGRALSPLLETFRKRLLTLAEFRTTPLPEAGQPSSVKVVTTTVSEVSLIKSLVMDHVNYNSVIADLNTCTIINPRNFEWMW
jgi:hypothetical protein